MADNMFLKNFLKVRADEGNKALKKKEAQEVIEMEKASGTATTYLTIIEDRPSKPTVLDYFRARIAELEEED